MFGQLFSILLVAHAALAKPQGCFFMCDEGASFTAPIQRHESYVSAAVPSYVRPARLQNVYDSQVELLPAARQRVELVQRPVMTWSAQPVVSYSLPSSRLMQRLETVEPAVEVVHEQPATRLNNNLEGMFHHHQQQSSSSSSLGYFKSGVNQVESRPSVRVEQIRRYPSNPCMSAFTDPCL
ncbi:hypothetical protein TKK_0002760 [Trichogramma kaykai]